MPPNEQAVAIDMRTEIRRALGTIRSFIAQSFYVWFCARRVTIVSYTDDAPRVPAPQVFFSEFRVAGDVRKLSALLIEGLSFAYLSARSRRKRVTHSAVS